MIQWFNDSVLSNDPQHFLMSTFGFGSTVRRSPFSSLDVRAKLAILAATVVLAFCWESPVLSGALACGVLLLCPLARLQGRGLKRLLVLPSPCLPLVRLV